MFKKLLNKVKCKILCCYKSECSMNESENDNYEKKVSS